MICFDPNGFAFEIFLYNFSKLSIAGFNVHFYTIALKQTSYPEIVKIIKYRMRDIKQGRRKDGWVVMFIFKIISSLTPSVFTLLLCSTSYVYSLYIIMDDAYP